MHLIQLDNMFDFLTITFNVIHLSYPYPDLPLPLDPFSKRQIPHFGLDDGFCWYYLENGDGDLECSSDRVHELLTNSRVNLACHLQQMAYGKYKLYSQVYYLSHGPSSISQPPWEHCMITEDPGTLKVICDSKISHPMLIHLIEFLLHHEGKIDFIQLDCSSENTDSCWCSNSK